MLTFSLQSGSNGNCIYVEAGDARLLFDAGISGKNAEGRLRLHDRDIRRVDAVIISHDHADHVRCAGVFNRKFGLPLWITQPTYEVVQHQLAPVRDIHYFESGQTLRFKDVLVHTLPTPHDAADGVGFIIEHGGRTLGILTDLGHPFAALGHRLADLDAVYLESNYDPDMLRNGPYPFFLQQRIRGDAGHLSNAESAELIRIAGGKLQWAALSHLSEHNNTPDLALVAHRRQLGDSLPLYIMSRYQASESLAIR